MIRFLADSSDFENNSLGFKGRLGNADNPNWVGNLKLRLGIGL